jgi:DNA adenine methylase
MYASAWEQVTDLSMLLIQKLIEAFEQLISGAIYKDTLEKIVLTSIREIDERKYFSLFDSAFIIDVAAFKTVLVKSLTDKCRRIYNIQLAEKKIFSNEELKQHLETGIKSGLYLYLRNISNKIAAGTVKIPVEKAIANWYFVREFCYASMFRFNKKGGFNIPYGGIAYNCKNFRTKVNAITSGSTAALFKRASFYNLDFQQFLEQANPNREDFVFLDPPYDSEFSEYDQNVFTKDDQVRLRDVIVKCKAKCMVVIKETEFIKELYEGEPFTIIDFDKTYTYNVRGRNNRGTRHLIILNYPAIDKL